MKKLSLYLIFLLYTLLSNAQGYKTNKEDLSKLPKAEISKFGFSTVLPTSHSLRRYAPEPSAQEGATCVGWAIAYSAMSIIYNKAMGITNKDLKLILAFDPIFTYALAHPTTRKNCDEATSYSNAIIQLLEYGAKRSIMPPIFMNCDERVFGNNAVFSNSFIPKEVYNVELSKFNTNKEKIDFLKKFIAAGNPLPFGMNSMSSMLGNPDKMIANHGLWQPEPNDEMEGGHAMTIIGYNDNKHGGAFEIMNSWGSNYADRGFMWIKYSDFVKYSEEVVLIEPIEIRQAECMIGDCYNSYSSRRFSSGDRYEGWVTDGAYDVYGAYAWEDGTIYAGAWSDGKRHGEGIVFMGERVIGCTYNNGELVNSEIMGFAKQKSTIYIEMLEHSLKKDNRKIENKFTLEELDLIQSKIVVSK